MKKLILAAALALFIARANAQVVEVKDVPSPIVTTYQAAYPSATDVHWKKAGNYYIAETGTGDNDTYVTYDATGKIIESGEGVAPSAVPAALTTYVKTKYKNDHIKKVYKVKDADGKTVWKGKVKEDYLYFDENGNYMKMKKD